MGKRTFKGDPQKEVVLSMVQTEIHKAAFPSQELHWWGPSEVCFPESVHNIREFLHYGARKINFLTGNPLQIDRRRVAPFS